ncbi:malto-oligosyltrehalose synthase [Candidatus Gracilibacteria bacterium]|nr:malto-oligosyltrehalose synthase [Candidatus Gracilibacteria bacterium]NJP18399.1 malto-oligosyltrehalose synthase [Hydrococcus sp. CRU_1_1]
MKIPTATYRLQFHKKFPFERAIEIIDYLSDLGISDLYASPIFKARSGSTHGYDVVDPTQINPELGTLEQFERLISKLQQKEIGWLQDIVPNHMAYDSQNAFLMDILENGRESIYSDFFDIDWERVEEVFQGKILAPLLGNLYGECLENGEIQLAYDKSGLSVNYFSLRLPVRIESYAKFITHNLGQLTRSLGRQNPDFIKLLGILYLIKSIPLETKGRERSDQITFVKSLIWELCQQNERIQEFFAQNLKVFNGESGNPDSFNLLDSLLSDQFYRLCFWKVGAEEINYRRFFTVNELISVNVEELKVFNKTHALIEQFVSEGKFTGLRIDHIDGLYHPTQYLERLQEKMGDVYILVEKILEFKEDLPSQWQIQGTSGYDFLNYVNGLFCKTNNEKNLQEIYHRFTSKNLNYEELVAEKKHLIVEKNLAGDLDRLSQNLKQIATQTRKGSDFTIVGLKQALAEVLAQFPVYRTYIDSHEVSECDCNYINRAIAKSKQQLPRLIKELDFIQTLLLREDETYLTDAQKDERLHWVMKFQQLTGPLMAKGVEDTLLYIYNRLLSLNEVGGNPSIFGITPDEFHAYNLRRCDPRWRWRSPSERRSPSFGRSASEGNRWLHSMNATATHDTKRGEDMRSRINILSEMPGTWEQQVWTWNAINRQHKLSREDRLIPDKNDEYFFYQTLIGAFPFNDEELSEFRDRIKDYVIKAVREAKVHTAWLRPDSTYEEGYLTFVDRVLSSNEFLEAFRPFQKKVAQYSIYNSLSQVLLKYASPGVPDLYQGCELWDFSLVDPDNRRPVDYEKRRAFLQALQLKANSDLLKLIESLLATQEDGKIKLFLTYQLLKARKEDQKLFEQGDYQPLTVTGKFAENIIAFARRYEDKIAIAVAPRFLTRLIEPGKPPLGEEVWQDTRLEFPPEMSFAWKNTISQMHIKTNLSIGNLFQHFPVALLVNSD